MTPGVLLAITATVVYNLGFIMEKRALDRLPPIEAHRVARLVRTLFTAPAWLAGFTLICCGLVLQVVVLSLIPLTVAQPLQASGVVVTLLFSWLVLRERLGGAELSCIGVIAVAVLLLSLSQGGAGTGPGTHASAPAIALTAVPVAVIVAAVCLGTARTTGTAKTTQVTGPGPHKASTGEASVPYGFCAGLIYGYAGLTLKALSAATFSGPVAGPLGDIARAVTSPWLYAMLTATAAGMCLFQVALQRGRASIVIPVSLVMSTGFLVVAGSWLFHERLPATPVALAMRLAGGLAAVAVPVILAAVTTRQPAKQPKEGGTMSLDPLLLDMLACPIDKQALLYLAAEEILYNPRLCRAYHVADGIPVMLADQGESVSEGRHRQLLERAEAGDAVATMGVPVSDLLAPRRT